MSGLVGLLMAPPPHIARDGFHEPLVGKFVAQSLQRETLADDITTTFRTGGHVERHFKLVAIEFRSTFLG